jgi:hypothetical protein
LDNLIIAKARAFKRAKPDVREKAKGWGFSEQQMTAKRRQKLQNHHVCGIFGGLARKRQ